MSRPLGTENAGYDALLYAVTVCLILTTSIVTMVVLFHFCSSLHDSMVT